MPDARQAVYDELFELLLQEQIQLNERPRAEDPERRERRRKRVRELMSRLSLTDEAKAR